MYFLNERYEFIVATNKYFYFSGLIFDSFKLN